MKEIRIKAWKARQIEDEALRYRLCAFVEADEIIRNGEGEVIGRVAFDGDDWANVRIAGCDKASEKAVHVLVGCETARHDGGIGNFRTFGAWVPKSAIDGEVGIGDYRDETDRKLAAF